LIVHRCFAWDRGAAVADPNGPLWIPREFQGDGRHDNPDLYGCLYLSVEPAAAVAEQLAQFRGQEFDPEMLVRGSLPLALARLELTDELSMLDLDEPRVLVRERLRPSRIATHDRGITQSVARALFGRHPDVAGIAWWSTLESQWTNLSIFDRARRKVRVIDVRRLSAGESALEDALMFLGFSTPPGISTASR
jgi:hypothetical protein